MSAVAGCWAFVVALACESSVALVSMGYSPRFFPATYASSPYMAKLWHTTAAAVFPAVVAPGLALPGLLRLLMSAGWSVGDLLLLPANAVLWRALGVSLAHFVFDLAIMVWYSSDFELAMGRPLYRQMVFHHAASALSWPYALFRSRCVCPVAYYIITEASNVFLNIRWFFAETGNTSAIRQTLDIAFFLSFTAVRILPLGLALYVVKHIDWTNYAKQSTWLDLGLTPLNAVPFGLNLFWYSIIVRSAKKKLFPRE